MQSKNSSMEQRKTLGKVFHYMKRYIPLLVLSIIFAVTVYAVALLLLKGLTEAEIRKFPKGHLLVNLAKKLRLLK